MKARMTEITVMTSNLIAPSPTPEKGGISKRKKNRYPKKKKKKSIEEGGKKDAFKLTTLCTLWEK